MSNVSATGNGLGGFGFEGDCDVVGDNLTATRNGGPGFSFGSPNPRLKRLIAALADSIARNPAFPERAQMERILSQLDKEADVRKSNKSLLQYGFHAISFQAKKVSDVSTLELVQHGWNYIAIYMRHP